MDVKVIKKEESKLFPRVEVLLQIEFAGPIPPREEVRKEVSKKLGVNENLVVIDEIKGVYGERVCKVNARVYTDEKSIKELEPEHLIKRNKLFEEKKEEKKEEAEKKEGTEEVGEKKEDKGEKEEGKTEEKAKDSDEKNKGNKEEESEEKKEG